MTESVSFFVVMMLSLMTMFWWGYKLGVVKERERQRTRALLLDRIASRAWGE